MLAGYLFASIEKFIFDNHYRYLSLVVYVSDLIVGLENLMHLIGYTSGS